MRYLIGNFSKTVKLLTLCLGIGSFNICTGQIKDSVCIHDISKLRYLRAMDAKEFNNYNVNTRFFKKVFINDSLFISRISRGFIPESVFIGEYTSGDSIHFIDFAVQKGINFNVHFENLCYSRYISRNELPQLKKLILGSGADGFQIFSYTLYIQTNSGVLKYDLNDGQIPEYVRRSLMTVREGQVIVVENLKVQTPKDGVRTIDGISFEVRN